MGRAHEVRAKSMAASAAARSALFLRASKEIYMAAKAGEPDPQNNLALRSAIEKWRGQNVTKDVIENSDEYTVSSFWTAFTSESGARFFWCWSVNDSADWTIEISSITLVKNA